MAKAKSIEDQIAEHEAAIKKLRDDAAAAAVQLAEDKKAALHDALAEYNAAAKATGGRAQVLRLVTEAQTAGRQSGGGSGKRLRLSSEQADNLKTEILKAAKSYKSEGASRKQILERLSGPNVGLRDGQHFNGGFVTRFLAELKADGRLKQEGDKSTARYIAA